jgi:hypothetical protein
MQLSWVPQTSAQAKERQLMALEELKAQIALLLSSLEDNPEDPRELHEMIRQHLAQIKAMGLELPADLIELDAKLERDFERRK